MSKAQLINLPRILAVIPLILFAAKYSNLMASDGANFVPMAAYGIGIGIVLSFLAMYWIPGALGVAAGAAFFIWKGDCTTCAGTDPEKQMAMIAVILYGVLLLGFLAFQKKPIYLAGIVCPAIAAWQLSQIQLETYINGTCNSCAIILAANLAVSIAVAAGFWYNTKPLPIGARAGLLVALAGLGAYLPYNYVKSKDNAPKVGMAKPGEGPRKGGAAGN